MMFASRILMLIGKILMVRISLISIRILVIKSKTWKQIKSSRT